MQIGIIGYGFVGKALHNAILSSVDVFLVDPALETDIADLKKFSPEITFVCVPTPMNEDGSQDISIVQSVFDQINHLNVSGLMVLKSTVLPDNLLSISVNCPDIVFNPEFLREKFANDDFINSNLVVLGGRSSSINSVSKFYKNFTKCKCVDHVKTDLVTASLIKYSINTFLATKLTFFNELYSLFNTSNAGDDWNKFISYLSKDNRIGNSHMSVPGHDGKFGFGGACLPKDSKAFSIYANEKNTNLDVLNSAIDVNNLIRGRYNLDNRESSQNINFKNNKVHKK